MTVRAVRHYHARGLLPEPERDSSGYRRYEAQAAIDLIRIKTLADAGVPLSRVAELMRADPIEFRAATAEIDRHLREEIRRLKEHRARVAQLESAERLALPPGLSSTSTGSEPSAPPSAAWRSSATCGFCWPPSILSRSSSWMDDKLADLEDPDFVRFALGMDRAYEWAPDDPRLVELCRRHRRLSHAVLRERRRQ